MVMLPQEAGAPQLGEGQVVGDEIGSVAWDQKRMGLNIRPKRLDFTCDLKERHRRYCKYQSKMIRFSNPVDQKNNIVSTTNGRLVGKMETGDADEVNFLNGPKGTLYFL